MLLNLSALTVYIKKDPQQMVRKEMNRLVISFLPYTFSYIRKQKITMPLTKIECPYKDTTFFLISSFSAIRLLIIEAD
jgi:hypothetical protein